MIPNVRDREMETAGASMVGAFGISLDDSAHIMTILRDTLYSDKIMAVLREYGANAWDAHRSIGKHEVPISVTIPTTADTTLTIRDFGPGLSREDVFNVFTQYGASTKRKSDTQVGMLGIGSKSGFAYADSFTITSWHDGMKRVYVAVLDPSDKGLINLLHEEPCSQDETGVQIQIAAKQHDIREFEMKAGYLYQHFNPQPQININLPKLSQGIKKFDCGYLCTDNFNPSAIQWTAIMGCVPYRLNLQQLTMRDDEELPEYFNSLSGVLYFDIGEVQINASREELKYGDPTKKAIRAKLDALVDSYVQHILNDIATSTASPWDKRQQAQVFSKLGLPVPADVKELASGVVDVSMDYTGAPPSFKLINADSDLRSRIHVNPRIRFIIRDDPKSLKGFNTLTADDVIVSRINGRTELATVDAELANFLAEKKLTGVPILSLAAMPWASPRTSRGTSSKPRVKHTHRIFKLLDASTDQRVSSENWEFIENHEPSPDDVYVVMEKFYDETLFREHDRDESVLKVFGMVMPTIYGYRSTDTRPVDRNTVIGIEYSAWRKSMLVKLLNENKHIIDLWSWSTHVERYYNTDNKIEDFSAALGPDHWLVTAIRTGIEATKAFDKIEYYAKKHLARLYTGNSHMLTYKEEDLEGNKMIEAIKSQYPLLGHYGMHSLWSNTSKEWFDYVVLVDQHRKLTSTKTEQEVSK